MSKSILILDKNPETCRDCFLMDSIKVHWNYDDFEYMCIPTDKTIKVIKEHEKDKSVPKPDWCPLKSVPKKMEGENSIKYQWGDYEDGWNHCIEYMIGEDNDSI